MLGSVSLATKIHVRVCVRRRRRQFAHIYIPDGQPRPVSFTLPPVKRKMEHYAKLTEIITLQIFRLDDKAHAYESRHEYSNEFHDTNEVGRANGIQTKMQHKKVQKLFPGHLKIAWHCEAG